MGCHAYFRGTWIEPGDPLYDGAARPVFNQRVSAKPAVVARCAGVSDVVTAVTHAREHGLRVDVRSGGYNLGGHTAGGGMVVDLSLMRGVQILPKQRIARLQGGVRGGDLQIEATLHGLAGATGAVSRTGVGLMLAGGIGLLSSRIGYASDNIVAVELVTATGEVVTASPDRNPDLFWAVRGSTGNFGVVTALEVRLHEVPPLVHMGMMSWPLDKLDGPIRALSDPDWASDDLNLIGLFNSASFDGRGGLDILVCHSGTEESATADLERLRSLGASEADTVRPMTFREATFLYDDLYAPMRATIDDQPVRELGEELVQALVDTIREPAGGGMHVIEIVPLRGALTRPPEFPSALRETALEPGVGLGPAAWWEDASEDGSHDRWVAEVIEIIRRIGPATGGQHPNGVGITLDLHGVERMYGDRIDRLRELKRRWDPGNLFPGNHNIPPAIAS
jgi:FAD/FMN-containing dehydrogenase